MEPSQGRADQTTPAGGTSMGLDRRARRRQQTIDEILDVAIEVMAEEGVAGLSLSEVARRMGIQPPSLYKYFPSKLALYDALFQRGARENLAVFQVAVERGELHPGAASEEGTALLSVLVTGVMSQQLANQPQASWDKGRFTRLTPRVLELFRCAYPPERGER